MRTLSCMLVFLIALATTTTAFAHAFPRNSSPHVGATVATSPKSVRVWFDGELEPVFSTLLVKNAASKQVSAGKGNVDGDNPKLLETKLPTTLPSGKYEVEWSVVSHDGHHTAGHFAFTVK